MNQKQKKFLEGQENEKKKKKKKKTRGMIRKQKLKIASTWMAGTQNDSSFKRVSDEQESEAHKNDDKTNKDIQFVRELTPAWNWYCPTTPAWRKQKCKQFLRILPTPNSNSECRKKGAPLIVDVIEGDGNCLFRAISYEVT